jgi:hypothetical protein
MEDITPYLNKEIDPWYKEGFAIGYQEGLEIGRFHHVILNMVKGTDFDDARIAALAAVPEGFVKKIRLKHLQD